MLRNLYFNIYKLNHDPQAALDLSLEITVLGLRHLLLRRDVNTDIAFRIMGLQLRKDSWHYDRDLVINTLDEVISDMSAKPRKVREPFFNRLVIFEPDTVGGVPDPDCMLNHLPMGRDPTEEEFRKALEACRK